jgi:hypothetical protein
MRSKPKALPLGSAIYYEQEDFHTFSDRVHWIIRAMIEKKFKADTRCFRENSDSVDARKTYVAKNISNKDFYESCMQIPPRLSVVVWGNCCGADVGVMIKPNDKGVILMYLDDSKKNIRDVENALGLAVRKM